MGEPGIDGQPGTYGLLGPTGLTGPPGAMGEQGVKGARGESGMKLRMPTPPHSLHVIWKQCTTTEGSDQQNGALLVRNQTSLTY